MPKSNDKGKQRPPRKGFFAKPWVAPVSLALLTLALYARSLLVPIHDWDDYVYYFRDARLEHLTPDNLWRIVTQPFFANFHPITTLTYAFDRAVWGTWVPGFHLTQIAFYVGGVVALYFLFARVLGGRGSAFAAAAIFATHTIHVESVAWLASRKDVVCLFFYAVSLLAYVRYAASTQARWRPYLLAFVLAALAMFSKGYAVVLPAVFLAFDFCFSGRISRRQVLDKLPFLALSAVGVLLTTHAQDKDSALIQSALPSMTRVALLAKIFALYVGRSILPVRLSAFYTVGGEPVESAVALLGGLLAVGLVAGFFMLRRRAPAASFGIALFLLPLATVMNFFFTLRIWMTDRYLLFPTIGSSLALVAIAMSFVKNNSGRRAQARAGSGTPALAILAALAITLYSAMTVARIGVWTNSVTLWSDVLRKDLGLAGSGPVTAADLRGALNLELVANGPLMGLVHAYVWAGNKAEADRIAQLVSGGAGAGTEDSEITLAQQALEAGRYDEALRRFKALSGGSTWMAPLATIWTGVVEKRMGDKDASRQSIQRGIDLYHKTGQPATEGLLLIGTSAFRHGEYGQAVEWYRMAQAESPHDAKAAFHLGRALEETGKVPEAMDLYKRIASGELRILPGSQFTMVDVYLQMAVAAQKLNHRQEAIGYFEEALKLAPGHPKRDAIRAEIEKLRAQPGAPP